MEKLSPTLACLLELRATLEAGEPVRLGLARFFKRESSDFSRSLFRWTQALDRGDLLVRRDSELEKSPYRKILLDLLRQSFNGASIYEKVVGLEQEVRLSCEQELNEFVVKLPFKLMIPLLLLQFPAFLILLLGPLFSDLLRSINT